MQETTLKFLKRGILLFPELTLQEKKPETIIEAKENTKTHEAKGNETVEIIETHTDKNTKTEIKDFVSLYNNRYLMLQAILKQRQELHGITTIRKAIAIEEKESVSFIAMVLEIGVTKNNNLMLSLEDQTGIIKAVVSKSNKELFEIAKELTHDEVIGIQGTMGDKIVFVKSIIFPDVPLTKELKKSPYNEAAVFISDIHIGSKAFLEKDFEKFISWISGGQNENDERVKKIKYLFILGDLVEGIGIYPDQERELKIKDLYEQYHSFCRFIERIPEDIKIIICPGNHDSVRTAEPQPPIPFDVIPQISKRKNLFLVSSPSIVKIGASDRFSGFEVLIYHGYSFPHYADSIESIRLKGGLDNIENIMNFLLKKRHLAPAHGSTQYQLGYDKDPLVIKNVPDFFVTGHIHKISIKNYRNVTMMNCSCWVGQTEYQEKRGIVPHPSKAVYVDLKTRETKILTFSD